MIQITEKKLKAAIQIALGSKGAWSDELETIIIHDIKALSIPVVVKDKRSETPVCHICDEPYQHVYTEDKYERLCDC